MLFYGALNTNKLNSYRKRMEACETRKHENTCSTVAANPPVWVQLPFLTPIPNTRTVQYVWFNVSKHYVGCERCRKRLWINTDLTTCDSYTNRHLVFLHLIPTEVQLPQIEFYPATLFSAAESLSHCAAAVGNTKLWKCAHSDEHLCPRKPQRSGTVTSLPAR